MKKISTSLGVLCLAATLGVIGAGPASAKSFVYVSNAEDGDIDGYTMDKSSGVLTPIGKTKAGMLVMPMTVSPDKHHLYAVVRSLPLRVVTYAIDPKSGALTEKGSAPLPESMAYLSTDKTGRFLFSASYGGSEIAVNKVDPDGIARTEAIQVLPTGKNAHSIRVDNTNKFVYSANLGANQVLEFLFDSKTGKLTPNDPPLIKAQPDNGPRHPAFSPDNKYLYVVCELSGNVIQYGIDQKKGTLTELNYVGTVPANSGLTPGKARAPTPVTATSGANTTAEGDDGTPKIWAADIQITPNGKFVYTTERTKGLVALLTVAPKTGKLTYVTNYETEAQPRGIRLDSQGKFLVVSGEKSTQISSFKINQKTGGLTLVGRYPVGKDANWVEIVDLP
ncbi:MAG TPA: beta-propeller fold lactonase family protein [Telmatospirillum sp.]|nr:beta-propeller fold lactonase family protein [Telmatospirillum sp.]